ncbi:unnamed protein product [Alopecurus aequalis]
MEVLARRRPSHLLAALLLVVLLMSFPYQLEARAIRGNGKAPAESLVDASGPELRDGGGRRLLQRSAPPPPAPVSGPPIGPNLPYSYPPPPPM